jgi:hypothetical protein
VTGLRTARTARPRPRPGPSGWCSSTGTRAEYEERAWLIESNDALAATHDVDIIEVAGAQHGFESMDDTDAAREAIRPAIAWAAERVGLSPDIRADSR